MRRLLIFAAVLASIAGIFWFMVSELEHEPSGRDEPPAIRLRAPDGFVVTTAGAISLREAVDSLSSASGERVGIEFSDEGDTVILLADRAAQQVIEMRAARAGTIVERTWPGDVDRRLEWAAANGNLDVPGLPPATGKNLYH